MIGFDFLMTKHFNLPRMSCAPALMGMKEVWVAAG